MSMRILVTTILPLSLLLAACQSNGSGGAESAATNATADAAPAPGTAAGKPSAPITIRYKVLGTAIVGQPVPIEVIITSSVTDRPISVSYHINDSGSMLFPASQPQRVDVRLGGEDGSASRQVTVVPQREGRLYLNILAEIETEGGRMLKSTAIPIAVGRGAAEAAANGELQDGADGERVRALPADEN